MSKPQVILYLDDWRGIGIPRDFVTGTKRELVSGVSDDDWEICKDPDHAFYWEAWDNVCNNAKLHDPDGTVYTIHQDGACWLIPVGMEYNEQNDTYDWPEDDNAAS